MKMYFTICTHRDNTSKDFYSIDYSTIHTYIGTYFKELLNDTKYHMP